ncbi:MAG TPA: hypothetical protein VF228_03560 [Iamia sp.]
MEGLTLDAAEDLAERCLAACNLALRDGDASGLVDLLTADAVIEVAELTTDFLEGPDELAERLAEASHHGGMVLMDVRAAGPDVVAGVAWEDDPSNRTAEVRLVPDGDRIARLEWVR